MAAGRDEVRSRKVEHIIRNLDGTLGERDSYGNDPREIPRLTRLVSRQARPDQARSRSTGVRLRGLPPCRAATRPGVVTHRALCNNV